MLCLRVEKTKLKCDPYWLYDDSKDGNEARYQIKLIEEGKVKCVTTRKIEWKNLKSGQSGIVTQKQLHEWNDGDRPSENIKE